MDGLDVGGRNDNPENQTFISPILKMDVQRSSIHVGQHLPGEIFRRFHADLLLVGLDIIQVARDPEDKGLERRDFPDVGIVDSILGAAAKDGDVAVIVIGKKTGDGQNAGGKGDKQLFHGFRISDIKDTNNFVSSYDNT